MRAKYNNYVRPIIAIVMLLGFLFTSNCVRQKPKDGRPPAIGKGDSSITEVTKGGSLAGLTKACIPSKVIYHCYGLLREVNTEKTGFGLYTYVLFGRRVDGSLDPEVIDRYKSVLEQIYAATMSMTDLEDMEFRKKKEEFNIFYIPSVAIEPDVKPSLQNYNSSLAMKYLTALRRTIVNNPKLSERIGDRPGPFLISLLTPIGQVEDANEPMLYADLSQTNPAAISTVVIAYKKHIVEKGVSKTERFSSLRVTLLNLILNADDNLELVKVAWAELREMLEGD